MAEKINFGTRGCKLCPERVPTELFGRHVISVHEHSILGWPGGVTGFMKDLRESVEMSIIRAEGHPEAIAALRESHDLIERLLDLSELIDES